MQVNRALDVGYTDITDHPLTLGICGPQSLQTHYLDHGCGPIPSAMPS